MAIPESTVWDRDPHTEAKHIVLRGYFDAWYPIMLRTFPRLTVLEGYAGPGVYSGGEDGSPVIAIRSLVERSELLTGGRAVRFVFIEEREDRLDSLREVIGRVFPSLPTGVRVEFHRESCEHVWELALDQAGAWGMPIFANLDPFGPGVPYALVERLGANGSSEVLVTFNSDWLRRFWSLDHIEDGDIQFGTRDWRRVGSLGAPEEKELFLVQEYRRSLTRAQLGLSAPFRLTDEGGHSFYLIFGTSHRRGLERMKDSMWRTDPVTGVRFRDPRDPGQGVLDFGKPQPDLSPLTRMLHKELSRTGSGRTIEELRDFILFDTGFRPPHATMAVQLMIDQGDLNRTPSHGRLTGKVRVNLQG